MPVIINSEDAHPFLPSVGSPSAIERSRAEHQDIRPMEFCIINLMADKQSTERQLAMWLGNTTLQVRLTFAATDDYVRGVHEGRESKNTPADHIRKFYSSWSDIKEQKFDGLIVTGVNALQPRVTDEEFWPDVERIIAWSDTNVLSSLFLCWGAYAAFKHFHNIEPVKNGAKIYGLFEHQIVSDKTGILFGFPDKFLVPVSRWKGMRREDIVACKNLEIVGDSVDSGPNMIVEPAVFGNGEQYYPKRLYVLNHPEYETDTLAHEYRRDVSKDPRFPLPKDYFPENDPSLQPRNSWRHTAHFYTNWVKLIYEATPYRASEIPSPFRSSSQPA